MEAAHPLHKSRSSPLAAFLAGALVATLALTWLPTGEGARALMNSVIKQCARLVHCDGAARIPIISSPPGAPASERQPWLPSTLLQEEPVYLARHRSYPWVLPELVRKRGVTFAGSGERMERFASKLIAGQPVKVVAVGGSVTVGAGSMGPEFSYPGRIAAWLNATFPHPDHQVLNRGIGATTSGIFALCTSKMVPQDPDLVVVEFSFNEPHWQDFDSSARKGFEQLLRKLLRLPSRPAVVLLHHYAWWLARLEGSKQGGIFWEGAETQLSVFAQYYDVPSTSLRSAAYHLMRRNLGNFQVDKVLIPSNPWDGLASPEGGKPGESFYFDAVHPTDFGHNALAELVLELVWQAVTKVTNDRLRAKQGEGQQERQLVEGEEPGSFPPPMVPGNADVAASSCFMQEDFKGVVSNSSGFSYEAARPNAPTFVTQKWAWSGTAPGAWAELLVNSLEGATNATEEEAAGGGSPPATVILGYLRSYESMGRARVACVAGCSCSESFIEGTWERRATIMQMHQFQVTQHASCRIRVSILPETSSGAHKISLSFLMVSAFPIKMDWSEEQAEQIVTGEVFVAR